MNNKHVFIFIIFFSLISYGLIQYFHSSAQKDLRHSKQDAKAYKSDQEGKVAQLSETKVVRDKENDELEQTDEEVVYFPRFDLLNEQELDEIEAFYSKIEEEWNDKMRNLFINDLKLSERDYEDYLQIRENFEESRWMAFERFHEDLFFEQGESFSYRITEYLEEVEAPLAEKYRERILNQIGESHFKKFLEVKDAFNDDLRRRQDPSHGIILMHL